MSSIIEVEAAFRALQSANDSLKYYKEKLDGSYSPRYSLFGKLLDGDPKRATEDYNRAVRDYNMKVKEFLNLVDGLPTEQRTQIRSCGTNLKAIDHVVHRLYFGDEFESDDGDITYLISRIHARSEHRPIRTGAERQDSDNSTVYLHGPKAGAVIHVTQIYADNWRISWDALPDGTVIRAHWTFQGPIEDFPRDVFGHQLRKPLDAVFGDPHKK